MYTLKLHIETAIPEAELGKKKINKVQNKPMKKSGQIEHDDVNYQKIDLNIKVMGMSLPEATHNVQKDIVIQFKNKKEFIKAFLTEMNAFDNSVEVLILRKMKGYKKNLNIYKSDYINE